MTSFLCPVVDFCASANIAPMCLRKDVACPSSGISVVGEELRGSCELRADLSVVPDDLCDTVEFPVARGRATLPGISGN